MAQVTNGLRAILSHPLVYSALQNLMGAKHGRKLLVRDYIKPLPTMNVLDIGCGPADILEYLPSVNYWGFDVSVAYIQHATLRFGAKGKFSCKMLTEEDLQELPAFDLVLALGLLHHLDDDAALALLNIAHNALKPGGRLITIDPCLEDGQNPIARYLIMKDRGKMFEPVGATQRSFQKYSLSIVLWFGTLHGYLIHTASWSALVNDTL